MTLTDRRSAPINRRAAAWIAACTLVLLACASAAAHAATFAELHSVIVPQSAGPAGASPRSQDESIRVAMGQLLTRITGRRDAAFEPALEGLRQNARDYVEQVGAVDRDNLLVRFNPRDVEAALVALDQPIWGAERPLTLLWIAIDGGAGERQILGAEAPRFGGESPLAELQARFREQLEEVANERGLVLALPLLDLQDMTSLNFVDIWGGFDDRVRLASERYAPDDILVGRVRLTDYGAVTRWTLLEDYAEIPLGGQSLRDGLDALADMYAAEFSTLGRASATEVVVLGITSLDDYGRVMMYLESLSLLELVAPAELSGEALRLRVAARGGASGLQSILGLGNVLRPVPGQDSLTFTLAR
jgi:hypothetical protein